MSYALLSFFLHTFKDFFLCFTIMDLDINFIMLSTLGLLHFQSEYLYSLLILENSAIICWKIVPFFLYVFCCLLLEVLRDIHGRPLCLCEVHMCRAPASAVACSTRSRASLMQALHSLCLLPVEKGEGREGLCWVRGGIGAASCTEFCDPPLHSRLHSTWCL